MRLIYTLGWYLALPVVFLRLLWRSRHNPGYRRGWLQRLGLAPRVQGHPLWLHAVSVGETVAAAPLVRALQERYPDMPVLITSTTPTGAARAHQLFGERVQHCYLPFDTPTAVARFLRRTRPRLGVIMETEIWPNLFLACRRHGLPLILANARLSAGAARGYQKAGRIIRSSLGAVRFIGAQGEADAERFRTLLAGTGRVEAVGNLKFEAHAPPDLDVQAQALRQALGPAPLWLAASTHDGEEAMALRAHALARETVPDLRLLLVPRHPERFEPVRRLCLQSNLRVSSRSQGWKDAAGADILLGDSMGELELFYAVADMAFVGGSLVRVGGHNIIEAAACGCPIVLGPHTYNMSALREAFEQAQALVGVEDARSLGRTVARLMQNSVERERLAQQAQALLEQHQGARAKLLRVIGETLG